MPETEQLYLETQTEGGQPQTGLQGVINFIREESSTPYRVGNEFERLIKKYLRVDPIYKNRFWRCLALEGMDGGGARISMLPTSASIWWRRRAPANTVRFSVSAMPPKNRVSKRGG